MEAITSHPHITANGLQERAIRFLCIYPFLNAYIVYWVGNILKKIETKEVEARWA